MMAGRRVARRRPASFVQLDGSGGGLLLARRQKSVAKIGGVLKDSSSSSSSSSLESFESRVALFVLFGEKNPPLFFNEIFERKKCFSFFLPKTHFFLRFLVKITTQNCTTQNRIFGPVTEHKRPCRRRSRVVHKQTPFSRLERERLF